MLLDPLTIEGSGAGHPPAHGHGRPDRDPRPDRRPAATGAKPPERRTPTPDGGRLGGTGRRKKPADRLEGDAGDGRQPMAYAAPATEPGTAGERSGDARERTVDFSPVALGACPLCGSDVVEQPKSFGCSGWKQGCKFAIWKTIAGKAIGVRTAQALLKQGQTPVAPRLPIEGRQPFRGAAEAGGGEVRFDFDGGDRRRLTEGPRRRLTEASPVRLAPSRTRAWSSSAMARYDGVKQPFLAARSMRQVPSAVPFAASRVAALVALPGASI